jgi:metal-sulfur cluster biosynthetic enzyme
MSDLHDRALASLRNVIDPELGLDVVALGLVYGIDIRDDGALDVKLTMTTPACPLGEQIVDDAKRHLLAVEGVRSVDVTLVWEPMWTPDRMSEDARKALGWKR